MVRFSLALAYAAVAVAMPQPQLSPDPAGTGNVGNGAGLQFITGGCVSDADCASACCAGLASGVAVCSGPDVSFAQGKQGCGFGGAGEVVEAPEEIVDIGGGVNSSLPGAGNVGTGAGLQFITGQCLSDADCASACCAGAEGSDTATCSAEAVQFDSGKTGCGFGGGAAVVPDVEEEEVVVDDGTVDDGTVDDGTVDSSLPGAENVGTGNGNQFITGQCLSDADCTSACCAGSEASATATCSAEAVQFDSGKTGCGFVG